MRNIINIFLSCLLLVFVVSCDDKFEDDIVKDNKPEIPVTFDGATTVGFNPYYTVAYSAAGTFSITLSIPSTSRLKIKRVENIVAGATSINPGSLTLASSIQYLTAPVDVNGTTYTLNTSFTEFNTKVAAAARVTAAPAAGTFVERAFQIRLRMDDDTFIIPVQCRIRVTP
jgi:hypothetical protein